MPAAPSPAHIGTEHLLLGLLHEDTAASQVLATVGVSLVLAREQVVQTVGSGKGDPSGHIPFTPHAKQTLEGSLWAAQRLHQDHIAPAHLLRGLLAQCDCVGAQALRSLDVDLDALAIRADETASAGGPERGPGVSAATTTRARVGGPEPDDILAARLDDLSAERDALANALRRYGRHDETCRPEDKCSCGLQWVLEALDLPSAT